MDTFSGYREQEKPVSLVTRSKKSRFLWLLGHKKQLCGIMQFQLFMEFRYHNQYLHVFHQLQTFLHEN